MGEFRQLAISYIHNTTGLLGKFVHKAEDVVLAEAVIVASRSLIFHRVMH